jgi:hypothetical protein
MKNLTSILFAVLLFICFDACAQTVGEVPEQRIYNDAGELISVTSYYDTGQIDQAINYTEGIFKQYYENGQLRVEGHMKDGNPQGIEKYYYDTGELAAEQKHDNGALGHCRQRLTMKMVKKYFLKDMTAKS